MDGKKDWIPDWQTTLEQLRQGGQVALADDIEVALKEGRKIRAAQLLRASGIHLQNNGEPPCNRE